MKIKNIMNTYYGSRKDDLELKLQSINEKIDDDKSEDTTLAEAFLGGAVNGLRKGILINGVVYATIGSALFIKKVLMDKD